MLVAAVRGVLSQQSTQAVCAEPARNIERSLNKLGASLQRTFIDYCGPSKKKILCPGLIERLFFRNQKCISITFGSWKTVFIEILLYSGISLIQNLVNANTLGGHFPWIFWCSLIIVLH